MFWRTLSFWNLARSRSVLRSAAVPGRSEVRQREAAGKLSHRELNHLAAPGDGRTPGALAAARQRLGVRWLDTAFAMAKGLAQILTPSIQSRLTKRRLAGALQNLAEISRPIASARIEHPATSIQHLLSRRPRPITPPLHHSAVPSLTLTLTFALIAAFCLPSAHAQRAPILSPNGVLQWPLDFFGTNRGALLQVVTNTPGWGTGGGGGGGGPVDLSGVQPASAILTNLSSTGALTNAAPFQPASPVLTNLANTGALTNASPFQPASTVLTNLANTGALTNAAAFQPASATLTNLASTGALTNASPFQPASDVLTNLANTGALTNAAAFQPASLVLSNLAGTSAITNTAGLQPGSTILTNLSGTGALTNAAAFQPASTVLTNLANTGALTNASPFQPASAILTNLASTGALTNASPFQPANAVLTNLAATGALTNAAPFQPASTILTNLANTGAITNLANIFPLQIQSAWRPGTNMATLEAGYQAWELQFARTNAAGANVTLSAAWNFMVATNYLTNTFRLRLWVMNQSTNGPNASNTIWQAAVLRAGPSSATDWRVGSFGSTISATNTVAASYNGTNQITSVVIDLGAASLLAPGDACIVKLNRDNVNDTYVGVASVVAAALEYTTR